jgi:hypothetical protein
MLIAFLIVAWRRPAFVDSKVGDKRHFVRSVASSLRHDRATG